MYRQRYRYLLNRQISGIAYRLVQISPVLILLLIEILNLKLRTADEVLFARIILKYTSIAPKCFFYLDDEQSELKRAKLIYFI